MIFIDYVYVRNLIDYDFFTGKYDKGKLNFYTILLMLGIIYPTIYTIS